MKINQVVSAIVAYIGIIGSLASVSIISVSLAKILLALVIPLFGIVYLGSIFTESLKKRKMASVFPEIDGSFIAPSYILKVASRDDIRWISDREKELYQGDDVISLETLLEWHSCNPNGFYVIQDGARTNVGNIDILPIKQRTLEEILAGRICEADIRGDCLYSPQEKEMIKFLYVENLAILVKPSSLKTLAIAALLSNFLQIVEGICNPNRLENIYCIVATNAGKKFVDHLGFKRIQQGKSRKDGHDLYGVSFADFSVKAQRICKRILGAE